jgi:hypothetical protein
LGTPGGTREIGALGGTQREHGKGKAGFVYTKKEALKK